MAFIDELKHNKVIAIVRGIEPQYMNDLAKALYAGGIRMVECTFNQKEPESWKVTAESIKDMRLSSQDDMIVGAGTVLTVEQLHLAADAGAQFFVSPNLNENVIAEAKRLGMGSLPGVLTPSEAVSAYEAGADAVKLFPAGSMGAGYLKAIRAPLSHIPIVVVGGIDASNIADFMKAGAIGAGVGGHLAKKELIISRKYDVIEQEALKLINAVNQTE